MFCFSKLFHRKPSPLARKPQGFTLIELLVGIMISSVIIMPLLGLVDSLLREDRQEQVKSRSPQELAAALDYIARDMQEAVYIYDKNGVTGKNADGIADDLPTIAGGNPVLVFWKRRFLGKDCEIDPDNNTTTPKVKGGCLETLAPNVTTCKNQDYYVFSLVVYYLIDNNTNNPNNIWAKNAMRIARWELRGGIETNITAHPKALPARPGTATPPIDSRTYLAYPEPGFMPFNLNAIVSASSSFSFIAQKMNQWQPHPDDINPDGSWKNVSPPVVLVDYLDSPTTSGFQNSTSDCSASEIIPDNTTSPNSSFYACVPVANMVPIPLNQDAPTPIRPIAQVFIRGNALLRLENDPNNAKYSESKKLYFPTTSIRVQGMGLLGSN